MRPCTLRCRARPGRAAESVRSRDDWMWQQTVVDLGGTRSRPFCRLGWEAGKSGSYRTRCTLVSYSYEEQEVVSDVVWGFCVTMHAARVCRSAIPTSCTCTVPYCGSTRGYLVCHLTHFMSRYHRLKARLVVHRLGAWGGFLLGRQ